MGALGSEVLTSRRSSRKRQPILEVKNEIPVIEVKNEIDEVEVKNEIDEVGVKGDIDDVEDEINELVEYKKPKIQNILTEIKIDDIDFFPVRSAEDLATSANNNVVVEDIKIKPKKVDPHANETTTERIRRKGKEIFSTIPESLKSFYFKDAIVPDILEYHCIGFAADTALVKYNVPELAKLTLKSHLRALLDKGYPKEVTDFDYKNNLGVF